MVASDPKSNPDSTGGTQGGALIFMSDASAEAERLSSALRTRGYWVVDVPLGLLAGRVAVQRPSLVVLDADAPGTLETVQRMGAATGGKPIDILLVGEDTTTPEQARTALEAQAAGLFKRPVNPDEVVARVEQLMGPPAAASETPSGPTRSPALVAATRRPYRYEGNKLGPRAALSGAPPPPPVSVVPSAPPSGAAPSTPSSSAPSAAPPSSGRASSSLPPGGRAGSVVPQAIGAVPHARLSPELEQLLGRAEQRVRSSATAAQAASERLSPDAELDAVLPPDLLAALDEPIQADDDDDDDDSQVGTAGTGPGTAETGSRGTRGTPVGGTAPGRTGAVRGDTTGSRDGRPDATPPPGPPPAPPIEPEAAPEPSVAEPPAPEPSAPDFGNEAPTAPPARPVPSQPLSARATSLESYGPLESLADSSPTGLPAASDALPPRGDDDASTRPPRPEPPIPTAPLHPPAERAQRRTMPPPPARPATPEIPVSLGSGGGLRALARAVAARYTGALALEDSVGIRRVVFRDGDFVTAASSAEGETLVAFLAQRGDLPAEAARRVLRRVPPFGRHAGAALVAQGHLRQDELWTVLRAHAEWLLAKITDLSSGAASLEREVPQRLQAEPGVFGGATGAEVLLEMTRRTAKPADAIARLGGREAVLATGQSRALLAECNLSESEQSLVTLGDGLTVGELLARAGSDEFACVLLVLVELGVLHAQGMARRAPEPEPESRQSWDSLDAEALRQRVAARRALVDEGDYFALLGVSRDATHYDLRRAYQTLRKDLDPDRVLTAATVDLRDEVDAILEVLDEAYDILRDPVRRERYRRALERSPD